MIRRYWPLILATALAGFAAGLVVQAWREAAAAERADSLAALGELWEQTLGDARRVLHLFDRETPEQQAAQEDYREQIRRWLAEQHAEAPHA